MKRECAQFLSSVDCECESCLYPRHGHLLSQYNLSHQAAHHHRMMLQTKAATPQSPINPHPPRYTVGLSRPRAQLHWGHYRSRRCHHLYRPPTDHQEWSQQTSIKHPKAAELESRIHNRMAVMRQYPVLCSGFH